MSADDTIKATAVKLCGALSPRERETLVLSAKGYTTKEIGRLMGRSYRTVENYRISTIDKMGVGTTIEAVVIAAKAGLV
jgi:DNA-binding NarL/FixJ family response regulator